MSPTICPFVKFAVEKFALAILDPFKFAPVRFALLKFAPVNVEFVPVREERLASVKFAFAKLVLESFKPDKFAPEKFAPVRFAPGPTKYPLMIDHPLGSVGVPVKLCETTLVRVAEERFTPFKLSEFRFAPVRFADGPNKYPPNTCHPLGREEGAPEMFPDMT